MANKTTKQEVLGLLKAQYPIIYICSHEERRVIDMLEDICSRLDIDIYSWSFTGGLTEENTDIVKTTAADPMEVLQKIEKHTDSACFVLKDFHPYICEADITRKLRDLQGDILTEYKPIIILSPIQRIPPELEKAITILDYDLPSRADIEEIIDAAISQVSEKEETNAPKQEKELLIKACQGLTADEIENILAKSWVEEKAFKVSAVLSEKKQIIRKSGILEYYDNLEEFSNVGGMHVLKNWIRKRSIAFTDAAKEFGLPDPKGILLIGVPGTGKSLVCKSIANIWNVPLVKMDVGKIMGGLVGSSEENMRKALRICEGISPCIMWVDEIDKGLSGSGSSGLSDAGTTNRVIGTFLSWLQDKEKPVFVVATANNVEQLPPELLRKGRFDEMFFVDLPTKEERKEIFKIHLQKRGRDIKSFDLDKLSELSKGYSGAEIEQAIIASMFNVFIDDAGMLDIGTLSIEAGLREIIPLSATSKEQISKLREWSKSRARPAFYHKKTNTSWIKDYKH